MFRRLLLPGLVLCIGAGPAFAQNRAPAAVTPAAPAAPIKVASVEGVTEYRLANGLRVLLFPDASKPTTTVNITFMVGSRMEAYGETGMAHLLEHLVFKGSTRHRNIPEELTAHGSSPNGTTWYDRTNYFETFPATTANLEWALDLEADRMVHSFIAKKDLESEMTVVRNEFESGENDPTSVMMERMMSTAFLWHNYGKSTIGARSDIESVPIDRLQGFYRKYYQPDNAMLVVAGKFDVPTALRLIQQKFGVVPGPDRTRDMKIWPTYTLDPTQDGERSVTLRRVGDVYEIGALWHIPSGSHPDYAAVDVLTEVLGSEPTGRLYKALVETKKASTVFSFGYQLREPGMALAIAEIPKTGDPAVAQAALLAAVDTLITTRPATKEEVERGKAALLKNINLQLTNPNSVGLAFSEWQSMGDWRLFFLHRDRIKDVTVEHVNRVAQTYLKRSNVTLGTFIPEAKPDRAEMPPVPDVIAMVKDYRGDTSLTTGEEFDVAPANIDRRTQMTTLPGGLKFSTLTKKTRGGTVNVSITLRFGNEPALMNKGAAPSFAGGMLMRGTTRRTRQQMQDSIDHLQAQISVGGGATSASASITVKRQRLADALRLAIEMLREPRFDPKEFDLLKQEEITSLESQRSDPQLQAIITLRHNLTSYPKGHPNYVSTVDEQLDELKSATLEQAKAFYQAFYGASNGEIGVVGDFSPDSVKAILTEGLSSWKSPAPFARVPNPTRTSVAKNLNLETPDKANALVVAGKALPVRDDMDDFAALTLANYMLGGGFLNSRLATRIRQKEGLSYGVESDFGASARDSAATWIFFSILAPQNRDKVDSAFRQEMNRAIKDGFTEDEIAKAKDGWSESRKLARASDGAVASRLGSNAYLGRTFAWDAGLEGKVAALTAGQLRAVVAKYLDPNSLVYVKAGDFANKLPKGVP